MPAENFEKKSVSEPVLDSETRQKISEPKPPVEKVVAADTVGMSNVGFWGRNKWFVLILVFSLGVLAILAWVFTRQPDAPKQPKLSFKIEAPSEIQSGGEAVVKYVLENKETRVVAEPRLQIVLPAGASFVDAQPKAVNLSGTLYELADLSPGASVTVFVKAKFESGLGESLVFSGKVNFQLQGLSARFESSAEASAKIVTAGLSVEVSGPNSAANGQPVSYTVRYANQTEKDYPRVRLAVVFPPGFQLALATPKPNGGANTWDIDQLTSGSSGELKLDGSYSATGGESQKFRAELQLAGEDGKFYKQAEGEFSTLMQSQPLRVSQAVAMQDRAYALAGDELSYTINYQNTATTAARGARIVFTFVNNTIDLSSIEAEGAQVSGNEVTWSAASSTSLEVLSPNDSGTLRVSARIKNPPVNDRTVNPDVKTSVKIIANEYDSFIKGNDQTVKIGSEPALESTVDFVGGTRPLTVGSQSTYQVNLLLKNTTSDVVDGELVAFLPPGVVFQASTLNQAEAGKVSFNQSTGKLVWTVGSLRAYTGTFAPKRQLSFQVQVTPAISQVGISPELLKNIVFTGLENYTQREIELKDKNLSTSDFDQQDRVQR